MNLTKRNKLIIAGVALAGAAAVTGSAFTAGGLGDTSGDSFIGGTVRQTITGAVIEDVDYLINPSTDVIQSITVTFRPTDNVLGRTLKVALLAGGTQTGDAYTCTTIADADPGAPILPRSVCSTSGTEAISTAVDTVDFTVTD